MNQHFYLFTITIGLCVFLVKAYPVYIKNDPDDPGYAQLNTVYSVTLLLIVLSLTFAIGCLCCKRKKGFRNFSSRTSENNTRNIEFANPLSACSNQAEITLFPPAGPPGSVPITFDPLPPLTPKHQQQIPASNPRPAAFTDALTKGISVDVWFQEPQENFPRQQLHYLRECGRGWFGRVVEGEARGILPNGRTSRVIVRILREGATESEQKFFLHEAKPYMELSHPNLLRLLGKCLENDPFLLLFEACNGGDLKSWLTQNVTSRETLMQQGITLRMAADIAAGLAHMNHHGFVHTDLAARNVLVTSDLRVKVGDYGTSIEMFKDDYYCTGEVALPIRWCAPESLLCTDTTIETKEVTAPANVWSYGVVLWEICEFGKLPYIDLSDDQVIVQVLGSEAVRLAEPTFPSPFRGHLYYLMQLCWRHHRERPSISHILSMLNHLITSKIKTQNDMDDFERRWENMKPNTIAKTDNHTPVMSEERVKSDSDSGVVLDNKNSGFTGSEMDLSCKKSSTDMRSSSSMTISPQLSVTSSSGGEFFSQTSTPMKLKSPSLQNLQGSLDNINETVDRLSILEDNEASGLDLWLQNVEIKSEKDAKLVSGVYKAINDLDNALSLEKTSSSNESSCYDSPSSNRKETVYSQNPVLDFKLGPFINSNFHVDKRLKFQPESFQDDSFILRKTGDSSGTDTEDEIWRKRIEKGEFSEKVKEKSKSIADLMILTHIENSDGSESDSLPSFSFNKIVRQNTRTNSLMNSIGFGSDICIYSSLTAEQSDSDLKKFQNALKKKDMNDPSLNFLRRDSLSYFINNSNFKSSESGSNSSSNFQQTDHFLEISASDSIKKEVKALQAKKPVPEILVSDFFVKNYENLIEEPNICLDIRPKNFRFVYKEKSEKNCDAALPSDLNGGKMPSDSHGNRMSNDEISEGIKPELVHGVKPLIQCNEQKPLVLNKKTTTNSYPKDYFIIDSNFSVTKQQKPLISELELGDSGIIIDEPSENLEFILPITSGVKTENLSVILGSCEDFTLDYYRGLKTCSGNELNHTCDEEDGNKNESVPPKWKNYSKNQLDEKCIQENYCNNLMNMKNVESSESCDKMTLESGEICDKYNFIPDNSSRIYNPSRYCEEQSDDTYIDSGKSSDVLDDENFDLKPYSIFNNMNDHGFPMDRVSDAKSRDDRYSEMKQNYGSEFLYSENINPSSCASSEDFDGVKLLTPDDEKSSDTGFRDKSSLSESYEDVCPDKYNLEDIENELDDINPPTCIQCPDFVSKIENQLSGSIEKPSQNPFKTETSKVKDPNVFYCHVESELKNENLEETLKLETEKNQADCYTIPVGNHSHKSLNNSILDLDACEKYQKDDLKLRSSPVSCSDSKYLHFNEDLPPSYEEYEKLKNKMENTDECDVDKTFNTDNDLSYFGTLTHNFDKKLVGSPTNLNSPTEYFLSYDLDRNLESKFNTSEMSEIDGKCCTFSNDSSIGWYLHSRSDENTTYKSQNTSNSWLPESISNKDEIERNKSVNEEFLMAIRNELNEKLSKFQLKSTTNEANEDLSEDDNLIDDDILSENQDNILIQYNNYPKSLSPILEEKESDCSSASSLVLYSDYSNSTRTLSPAEFENDVIDTIFNFNNINPETNEFMDDKHQENDDIIVIDTETNEIHIIDSPKPKSELSTVSCLEDPLVSEHLENTDYLSDYSLDSISPITGSPSATNPNALSFSSTNENLSEVFLTHSSTKSDLTFAEDRTICSKPVDDCETDVEELEKDYPSPHKNSKSTEQDVNKKLTTDPNDLHSEAIKNMNNLLLNPSSYEGDLKQVDTSHKSHHSDSWLESVLLSSKKYHEENALSDDSDPITNSFMPSHWPKTHNLTVVTEKKNLYSTEENTSSISNQPVLNLRVENMNNSLPNSMLSKPAVTNSKENSSIDGKTENNFNLNETQGVTPNESKSILIKSHSSDSAKSRDGFSDSSVTNKETELNSTIAFEVSAINAEKAHKEMKVNDSCNDFLINCKEACSNSYNNNKGSYDSLEKYKNYCRKKFKITKVDEDVKPIFFSDPVKNAKSYDHLKDNEKTILTEDELNNRLNQINKEAQERLETSIHLTEPHSAFPPANKEDCMATSLSWPVSSQLLNSENLQKFGLTEIDISDDQMMSTSFIDSNSAENSETEDGPALNFNWDERDESGDKNSSSCPSTVDLKWHQKHESKTEFNTPLKSVVEKNDGDDDEYDEEDDEDIADFVPSSWNSSATPNKSALKSPEQYSDSKKNVSFKHQRYHCVYEYPREEHSDTEEETNPQSSWYVDATPITFDYSAFADWEMGDGEEAPLYEANQDLDEKVSKPEEKHDVYSLTPVDHEFLFNSMLEDGEFFISSSTRPFKTEQTPLNCQFFPGKTYVEENFEPLAADISEKNNIKDT